MINKLIYICLLVLFSFISCNQKKSSPEVHHDSTVGFKDSPQQDSYANYSQRQLFDLAQSSNSQQSDDFDEKFYEYMTIDRAKEIVLSDTMSGGMKISAFTYLREKKYNEIYSLAEQCVMDTTTVLLIEPSGSYEGFVTPAFDAYFVCIYLNSELGDDLERSQLDSLRKIQKYARKRWKWKPGEIIP